MVRVSWVRDESEVWRPTTQRDTASAGPGDRQAVPAPLMFAPDGSFDSAILEVAPRDAGDTRWGLIEADGANASFKSQIVTEDQLDEFWESRKGLEGYGMQVKIPN